MKKILLLTASAVLLLASCQKSAVVAPQDDQNEITFSGYTGRNVTKAYSDFTISADTEYHVYAYLGSSTYFEDEFKNNTAKSTGDQKTYYWPTTIGSSNKMVFYAVAPKATTLDANKKVAAFNAASGETDLVVAKSSEYSAKSESVGLTFNHALAKISKITLTPKSGDASATADYYYNVESLKITGNTVGTCDFSSTLTWSDLKTSGDYSYISSSESFTGEKTLKKETAYAVIPQTITITVKYNITMTSKTGTKVLDSVTKKGTIDVAAGNVYAITIALSNTNSPIVFNAEASPWTDKGTTELDVDPDNFEPIREALAAAKASSTQKVVTLNKNYEGKLKAPIEIPSGVTLDVNGYSLFASSGTPATFINVPQGAKLLATSSDESEIIYMSATSGSGISVISVARPSTSGNCPVELAYSTVAAADSAGVVISCTGGGDNKAVKLTNYATTLKVSYLIGKIAKEQDSGAVITVNPGISESKQIPIYISYSNTYGTSYIGQLFYYGDHECNGVNKTINITTHGVTYSYSNVYGFIRG